MSCCLSDLWHCKSTIYEASANNFINEELNFNNTQVIDRKISFEKKEIRVVLIGNEVSETEIATARDNLKLLIWQEPNWLFFKE